MGVGVPVGRGGCGAGGAHWVWRMWVLGSLLGLGDVGLGVPIGCGGCGSGGPHGGPWHPLTAPPAPQLSQQHKVGLQYCRAEHRGGAVGLGVPDTPFWGSPRPHREQCGSGGPLTTPPPPPPPQLCRRHKVGVLYCRAGQSTEEEMYNNECAGPAFNEFLSLLGERVTLKAFSKYAAQLDTKSEGGAGGGAETPIGGAWRGAIGGCGGRRGEETPTDSLYWAAMGVGGQSLPLPTPRPPSQRCRGSEPPR